MDPFLEELNRRKQPPADPFAEELSKRKYVQPEPPEGMILDPSTGQMVDTVAEAARQSEGVMGTMGTAGGVAVKGFPFAGEWMDELAGQMGGPVVQEVARQRTKKFEEDNPGTSTALKIGAGVSAAAPALLYGAPAAVAAAPSSAGGQAAAGLLTGLALGTTDGAISGAGSGTDAESRTHNAQEQAFWGGLTGGIGGAVTPALSKGIQKIAQSLFNRRNVSKAAKEVGTSKPAQEIVTRALEADDAFSGVGARNLQRAGPDAMLADVGPATRKVVDTSMQRSGKAGTTARTAIEDRATRTNTQLNQSMDNILGAPQGIKSTARDISQSSAPARKAAYDQAYSRPIDYASDSGRRIEDVLSRIPNRVKKQAIENANEAMQAVGERNQQIFVNIADDGSITFRNPPNVRQLDEIKRALGDLGAENVDKFGRKTAAGIRSSKLAGELRDAVSDAVSGYREAVNLGGDKIGEDLALDMGQKLLRPSTTREMVSDFATDLTTAQKTAAAKGLRMHLDETLAQVKRTVMDGNVNAREAVKAVKDLSSRANREKVTALIGKDNANQLFSDLDRASMALDLRAGVADNSATFARQSMDRVVKEASEPGAAGTLAEGKPVDAVKRLVQNFTGRSPQAKTAIEDDIYSEIIDTLVRANGGDAQRALNSFSQLSQYGPVNERTARAIAQRLAPNIALPFYLTERQRQQSR